MKVAINGFGRIGRLTARIMMDTPGIELVAVNDLTDNATLAHLFKYDSAHGRFGKQVEVRGDSFIVDGKEIAVLTERDPARLPWASMGVDVVVESTGVFRDEAGAGKHLEAGARKVVISAPAKGDIKTVVMGVNHDSVSASDTILSNASCTTNCLAPMVKVLDDSFGLVSGLMTTVHAYTSDQRLQDAPHSDLRRARAAAANIIPTSTGAAKAVGKVLPHLNGKLNGSAMRVPTITGSLTEFTCTLQKDADAAAVNAAMKAASEAGLKGILEYCEDPIVSSDIIGSRYSTIFDADLTTTMDSLVRVVGWYDNEAGYSNRIVDLVKHLATL